MVGNRAVFEEVDSVERGQTPTVLFSANRAADGACDQFIESYSGC